MRLESIMNVAICGAAFVISSIAAVPSSQPAADNDEWHLIGCTFLLAFSILAPSSTFSGLTWCCWMLLITKSGAVNLINLFCGCFYGSCLHDNNDEDNDGDKNGRLVSNWESQNRSFNLKSLFDWRFFSLHGPRSGRCHNLSMPRYQISWKWV